MLTRYPTRPAPQTRPPQPPDARSAAVREVPVRHEPRVETIPVETAAPAERAPRRTPRYVVVGGRRLRAS